MSVRAPSKAAANAVTNVIGQALVAVTAFLLLPKSVHALGPAQFGLLSLALVVLGSVSMLDLGLGKSTTKFVAQYAASGEAGKIRRVFWVSLCVQLAMGGVAAAGFAVAAPMLARCLSIPPALEPQARAAFLLLALACPFVLLTGVLRGALEGVQRFLAVNVVKVSLNACTYVLPLVGACRGMSISGIVGLLLASRVLGAAAYSAACVVCLPLRGPQDRSLKTRELVGFAGWIAVSNLVMPLLMQLDRILIGALVGVAAVTYYAVPFELLSGVWIIPTAIAAALFPSFSGLAESDGEALAPLFGRSLQAIALALAPVAAAAIVFSREILTAWQGAALAGHSSTVLQILVAAVFVNSLAFVPGNLLQAVGRPDLVAKCHLIQVPLYSIVAWILIGRYGLAGAAYAFGVRILFESVYQFVAVWRLRPDSLRAARGGALSAAGLACLLAAGWGLAKTLLSGFGLCVGVVLCLLAYGSAAWISARGRVEPAAFDWERGEAA